MCAHRLVALAVETRPQRVARGVVEVRGEAVERAATHARVGVDQERNERSTHGGCVPVTTEGRGGGRKFGRRQDVMANPGGQACGRVDRQCRETKGRAGPTRLSQGDLLAGWLPASDI